ncbi:hypothetical protein G6011_00132 [Alternaria panax]|uniref:Uncharacterized protein n=1 Tax=Alternaria panax TaxID=48097 RepID=A0AAD4IHN3_9PLEO|nr:hypothetical protein G6011_00132 [Alternaria panax]
MKTVQILLTLVSAIATAAVPMERSEAGVVAAREANPAPAPAPEVAVAANR